MDSSTEDDSTQENYSQWCDKRFTNMYSHENSTPSQQQVVSTEFKSGTKKTLYATSQERILASKGRQIQHSLTAVKGGRRDADKANCYEDIADDSRKPFTATGKQCSTTKSSASKLQSVVNVVHHSHQKEDFNQGWTNKGQKSIIGQSGECSLTEESSSQSTPDNGVSKRSLGDGFQEAESMEAKMKKKKHKKHDVVSPSTISVKVKSICSVPAKETLVEESRTNKHKSKKTERTERYKSEKKSMNTDSAQDEEKYNKEKVSPQQRKTPLPRSSREHVERTEMQSDVKSFKEVEKKVTVLSKVIKVTKEGADFEHSDKASPDRRHSKCDSPKENTTKKPGFNHKLLVLLHPPPLPSPPHKEPLSEDEDVNNNSSRTPKYTSHKKRSGKRSTKQESSKSCTHQRTSSTSSISSTSTSASSTSSVASMESVEYQESSTYKRTTKVSKTKVVSYKTAKHLHKSKRSKECGENTGSTEKETKAVKKHGMGSKETSSNSEKSSEKTKSTKKQVGKNRRGPDAAVLLSHIKKAFASSTESEPDGSPMQKASIKQHIKSLTANVDECTNSLKNFTAKIDEEPVDKKPVSLKEAIASHLPIEPCPIEALCDKHVYSKPADRKAASNSDSHKVEVKDILTRSPKDQGTTVPEQSKIDFHNTTYQLSTKKPSQQVSLACHFDNAEKVDTKKDIETPKQLTPTSLEDTAQSESVAVVNDANKIKTPVQEDYSLEPGELSSEDSDGESWSQMVKEITKENSDPRWNYVVDSQRHRLCVEGTTYAVPPLQWRTNWQFPGNTNAPSRLPPSQLPPPPRLPPPPLLPPPPPPPAPQNSLYQQASQRMFSTTAVSPFLWRRPWPAPSAPSPCRPEVEWEEHDWRTKRPERYDEEEYNDEIYYSSSSEDETPDVPLRPVAPQPHQYQYGYSSHQRNLPPRLMRQQQQYTPTRYGMNSTAQWTPSFYHEQRHRQNDYGGNIWGDYTTSGNTISTVTTPRQSWPSARNSLSPVAPFVYDTSSVMYPYSMRDYIDTHCHIDFLYQRLNYKGSFQKFSIENHFPPNYGGCVAIFCTPESVAVNGIWKDLLREEKIWGAFGIHPHHAKYYDGYIEDNIMNCMKHYKAVALGEIGLDYSSKNSSDWVLQKEVFRRQLNMALKMDKPLVIHSRDAEDDTIDIMASMVPRDHPIHRHCFTGTPEQARRWLSVFPKSFIGLTALVTFPSATGTHRTATEVPLERLLLETDSPYFLPRQCPRSLKYANPSMAVFVAERIARLRGITTDEVLIAVRKNTELMYGV